MNPENPEKSRKKRLLRRVRRQRLKHITILPSLITLLNGVCGFGAIVFAGKIGNEHFVISRIDLTNFAWAGYLIFVAMIADMLDGRVARISQTTSSFGGQLDSLCDMISFGVAPAFLMLKVLQFKMDDIIHPTQAALPYVERFVWLSAAVYVACTAIRLARFNVENVEGETSHMSFIGLPSPAAAGVISSLIVFYQDMLPAVQGSVLFEIAENSILFALPFISIGLSVLMISRIRYQHILNHYLKGRKPLEHLVWSVVIIGLIYWSVQTALVISFCGFTLMGLVNWIYRKFIKTAETSADSEAGVISVSDSNPQQN